MPSAHFSAEIVNKSSGLLNVIGVDTSPGLMDIMSSSGCSQFNESESLSTYALAAAYTWRQGMGETPAIEETLTIAHFNFLFAVLFCNIGMKYLLMNATGQQFIDITSWILLGYRSMYLSHTSMPTLFTMIDISKLDICVSYSKYLIQQSTHVLIIDCFFIVGCQYFYLAVWVLFCQLFLHCFHFAHRSRTQNYIKPLFRILECQCPSNPYLMTNISPYEDPVIKTQLFSPYLCFRFFLFLIIFHTRLKNAQIFLRSIIAPIIYITRVVFGHTLLIAQIVSMTIRICPNILIKSIILTTLQFINLRNPIFMSMIEESLNAPLLPTQEIISMIEEFIDCLNYPKTQAMLAQQKRNKNSEITSKQQYKVDQIKQVNGNNQPQYNKQQNEQEMIQEKSINENQQVESYNLNKAQMVGEQKKQQKQQMQEEKQDISKNKPQFAWKHQQAKFYSKFATFSQIVYCLQTSSAQRQVAQSKLIENTKISTNNQVVKDDAKQAPSLLHIISAFDTISKVKKFTVPIHRNFSLQPKFSKCPKFIQASPKEHFAIVIDDQSTIFLIHLKDKCLLQFLKAQEGERITSLKWLNGGTIFATGMASGKLNLMTVSRDRQISKLNTLHPHLNQITAIYCNKDYLYTSSSDYTIARVYIRLWKIQRSTKLKGDYLSKMTKIEHKKLKDIVFGIQNNGNQLIMIDEITGLSTVIFSIRKDHFEECRKLTEKKQQKIQIQDIIKSCWIEDVITNHDNNTLIIAVAGVNPSIYEVDPLRNQIQIRLNHIKLKQTLIPSIVQTSKTSKRKQQPNIYMTLSHKSQILAITTNSNTIFYVRIKNWRILHQYVQTIKSVKFGKITATKRNPQSQQSMIQIQSSQTQQNFDKQCVICVQNNENNNIEVYENFKTDLKVIRSDIARTRSFLATGAVFPTSTQGFLQLLQTIRQNYQALV